MLAAVSVIAFLAVLSLVLGIGDLLLPLLKMEVPSQPIAGLGDSSVARFIALVAAWNRRRPGLAQTREHFDRRLVLAGRPLGAGGGAELLALIEVVGVGLLLLFTALLLFVGNTLLTSLAAAAFVALAGIGLTIAWVESQIQDRERAISRQYPYFLDLAVMIMEAGSSFQETVDVYVRDSPPAPLREELQAVLQDLGLGLSEEKTLDQLRGRISSPDVRDSIHSITQGLRAGTPLGQLLRDQAEGLRFRRSQLAERIAEELKIRLMGPATLMMAAVILLILGPVVVNITQSGIF